MCFCSHYYVTFLVGRSVMGGNAPSMFDPTLKAHGVHDKATDDHLRQAAKYIEEKNKNKLATKYLGLSSKLTSGRDAFGVLKLWRNAMLYQGFKGVSMGV